MRGARPAEVRQQVMLRDREDVDEVEEQLEECRALLALAAGAHDPQLRDDRGCPGRHPREHMRAMEVVRERRVG